MTIRLKIENLEAPPTARELGQDDPHQMKVTVHDGGGDEGSAATVIDGHLLSGGESVVVTLYGNRCVVIETSEEKAGKAAASGPEMQSAAGREYNDRYIQQPASQGRQHPDAGVVVGGASDRFGRSSGELFNDSGRPGECPPGSTFIGRHR